jgi:glycerol-3-phosphate O-acyltransferase
MADILDKPEFQEHLQKIAHDSGIPLEQVQDQASSDLQEMRGQRSKLAVRVFAWLSRFVYRRGYHPELFIDNEDLGRVRKLAAKKSVVFLVTHKTYLDFFVLYDFLYRQGITPPFIFGGINMAFAGFGNIARKAGGIFIRRSFRDDPVYKAVLQRYIASLIEEKQSFMWAIEGTRSRTGKLVLPKLGLLKYVVDASDGLGDDAITYIPVCVAYDQIPDVIDMSAQEAGASKKPESISWFFGYVRKLGGHYGNIYVRFGDAVSLNQTPEAPDLTESQPLVDSHTIEIQKLAFEVCYRINEITPATVTSLVLMSLLCRDKANIGQIRADVRALQNYVRARQSSALFSSPNRPLPENCDGAVSSLVENGIIRSSCDTEEAEYGIEAGRYLVALYYSNMAVHHFVIAAFTELGLLQLSKCSAKSGDADFAAQMLLLRDLFKYEFFFARRDRFRRQFEDELTFLGSSLTEVTEQGAAAARALLQQQPLLVAESVLRPFVSAYQIVADYLMQDPTNAAKDPRAFVSECQALSRDAAENGDQEHSHIIPRALLMNGYSLAQNRGLLNSEADETAKRQRFADELAAVSAQLHEIRRMIG